MKTKNSLLVLALAGAVLLTGAAIGRAADEPAQVAGAWQMSVQGSRGTFEQALKIEQDGENIKGTLTGRRGETPLTGSVKGNQISFTVKRETDNGTFTLEYSGTIDGDAIKGTLHSDRFDATWTATREKRSAGQ